MAGLNLGKATWFFFDRNSGQGWTESWYHQTTDLPQLLLLAKDYAKERFELLGAGQAINYIRVSKDDVPNDSRVFRNGPYSQRNVIIVDGKPDDGLAADNPWQTVLIRCEGTGNRRKFMFMRGVPDRIIVNPPGPVIIGDPVYGQLFRSWRTLVLGKGWGWKANVAFTPPGAVISALVVGGGTLTVTVPAGGAPAAGIKVQFRGGDTTPKLNGTYTVLRKTDDTTFVIAFAGTGMTVVKYPGLRPLVEEFVTFAPAPGAGQYSLNIAGETYRKVGRPFGLRVGRLQVAK
jgi:hypothetical protein